MVILRKLAFGSAAAVVLLFAVSAAGEEGKAPARVTALSPASAPYIDAHVHVDQESSARVPCSFCCRP